MFIPKHTFYYISVLNYHFTFKIIKFELISLNNFLTAFFEKKYSFLIYLEL